MIDTGPISPISFLVISLVILQFLINWIIPQTRFTFIFNMILFFEGISVFLLQSKVPIRFGILLTLTSGYFILKSVRGRDNLSPSDTNIISKFFSGLKQNFPVQFFFPYVGFSIAFIDIGYNWFIEDSFGTYDRMIILSSVSWIGYKYVPQDFARERDFVFIFLNILILIFVLPSFIYDILIYRGDKNFGVELVFFLLVAPLENLLQLTGYDVWDHGGPVIVSDGSSWGILSFKKQDGSIGTVLIAEMCSGINSIYIFTSAFVAYTMTEYKTWDTKVTLLLLVGILTAYFANLLRMYLIVLVGIYWGEEQLYWAHANFGWLIFLFWIGIFWTLFLPHLMFPNPD